MERRLFFLLSAVSGVVELGCVFYASSLQRSLVEIIGVGLAYQMGNLVPVPIRLNRHLTVLLALLGALSFLSIQIGGFNYWLFFAGSMFMAAAIQAVRALNKEKTSTTQKRIFRVLGFLVSPFVNLAALLALSGLVCMASLLARWDQGGFLLLKPRIRFLNAIMIVHQMHYFAYAYFITFLIYDRFRESSLALVGVIFTLGWLSYISVPHVLTGREYFKYAVGGHVFVAIVLVLLGLNTHNSLVIPLWLLTGFGGGTVFCIERINTLYQASRKEDLSFSENIGHIVGVLAGLGAYLLTSNESSAIYLSALYALLTAILLIAYRMMVARINSVLENAPILD